MHYKTFLAKSLIGLFAALMFGTGQAVADNVEYFKNSDLSCEYIVPNKLRPELSYVRINVLYAHCYNGAEDMRSSGFRYDKDDSEYTGANLYLSDGVLKDACFLWFSTAGKNAAQFQFSGKANGADSTLISKNGWKIGPITYECFVKPTNPSDHDCKEAHYCYMHIILYPPTSMNNKTFTIRLDGGPKKNYGKQGRNWCWWREGGHYNQYGTTTKDFTLAFPYNVGKMDISDMTVSREGKLLANFTLPGDSLNATKIVQGEFICGNDTVKENSGFMSTYLVDNTLQNRPMASKVVRKYDGKKTVVSGRIFMPAGYNSSAETKAMRYYRGFPYAKMTEATFSMENTNVKLRWNIIGDSILNDTCVKGGHWYVTRMDGVKGVSQTVSMPLPLTTREWTDENIRLNKPDGYTYKVVYRRDDWGEVFDSTLTVEASSWHVTNTNTNCNLTVTTIGSTDRVAITAKWNASKKDGFYTMNIYRGNLLLQGNISMAADKKEYTTRDISGVNGTLYARVGNTYKVQLLHDGQVFDEKEEIGNITGGTKISALSATKGDYKSYVHLTWSADRSSQDTKVDTFIIDRRILNSSSSTGFNEVQRIASAATYVTYDDMGAKPGDYYEYRVSVSGADGKAYNGIRAIGYATATGTISGSVKLMDGTAQSRVTVSLEGRNEASTDLPKVLLHSIRMDGKNNQDSCMIKISQSADEYKKFVTGDYTIQFWYRADKAEGTEPLLTIPGYQTALTVEKQSGRQLLHLTGTAYTISIDTLSKSTFPWVHVTLQKTGSGLYCLKTAYLDAKQKLITDSCKASVSGTYVSTPFTCPLFGVTKTKGETAFNGEVDEVRMYNRSITDLEISDTRYCRLAGKEKDLYCYLPLDEGISGYTFDHAVSGGRLHGATLGKAATPSSATPDDFTAYSAKTDDQGFYAISGIELANATFRVKPTRNGINDKFGPTARYCTLSSDVTSLSDQNFVDSSSVSVSGRVCYRWGTYPVEGAKVKVDGITVQRNGRDVLTDRNGEFQIDIPVGGHYLEVAMADHGFLQGGRFPATDVYDFQRDTAYIDFTDSTLVLLRGRVSGGAQQAALPMAVGVKGGSKALIGQATLYIAPASNLNYRLNKSTSETITVDIAHNPLVQSDTAICRSTEVLLPYQANPTIKGQVVIKTDSASGEFRALLPPMAYHVTYGRTSSVNNDELNTAGLSEFNMKPGTVSKLNIRYDTKPIFEILDFNHQDSLAGNDGLYGEDTLTLANVKYPVIDRSDKEHPKYVMGYPVFNSGKHYSLLISAKQNFINADYDGGYVTNSVPLSGQLLSFAYNKWGDSEADTVRLNSQGRAVYGFSAAYPSSDEVPLFNLEGTCVLGGRTYSIPEDPVKALFTGFSLYDGQATLVDGPSSVDYILRDPPGSNSFATLEKGSTLTSSVSYAGNNDTGTQSEFHLSAGTEWNSDTWSISGKYNYNHNWSDIKSEGTGNGVMNSVTTTETYSTATDAYHVGAMGDLFIGHGTYTQYGKGYYYGIKEGTPTAGDLALKSADGTRTAVFAGHESMGCTVGAVKTSFALDERFILETLIPEWERVAKTSTNADSVRSANNNANLWRNIVALNELQKLTAFEQKADTTISYSSGLAEKFSFSSSVKQANSKGANGLNAVEWKLGNNNTLSFFVYFSTGGGSGTKATTDYSYNNEETRQEKVSHSYTLSDTDPKDNFDISVYNRASSPIFRINAGASTNPWEGADTTQCYMAGKKALSTPTWKVEKCSFRVLNPNITDIPNGREATVLLELTNESQADRDQTFVLVASDETHNTGLVMTIDGAALTTAGIPIFIGAHKTVTKTMKIKQTRQDILNYDNLKLNLSGQHIQTFERFNPELFPERVFSVHFTPSSSPVTFTVRDTTDKKITSVNISSGTRIKLRAEDYQTDYQGFYKMRMQYKAANETQWHTLGKEWPVKELDGTVRKDTLWDMKDLADGKYQLRAVTLSQYGTGDVPFYSDTITIVKDMVAPQLLGEPQPVDGKLGCESEIRYTFSEDIYSGAVTKSNISIKMYKGSVSAGAKIAGGEDITFDFVVSENTIVISPTIDKRLMEGNTLVVTLSDIEDLNGNKADATPAKYIYVHQSPFAWIQGSDDVVAFYNMSSGVQQWSLQNIPAWIELYDTNAQSTAATSGTVGPNEYVLFYKHIKSGLTIGEYCDTMRVVDSQGLGENIVLRYTQYAEYPYWTVKNPYAQYNTTFTAKLMKDGIVRATDLIGAFVNDTVCVGAAYPTYVSSENEYRVMMNIYTDESQKGKTLEFKLYDSMHDVIYPDLQLRTDSGRVTTVTAPQDYVTRWGTTDRPWKLSITDWNEHIYNLNWGWNWVSFNMDLEQDKRKAQVFLPENAPVADLETVKTQSHSSTRDGKVFHGDLTSEDFEPGGMLMVKANDSYQVSVRGYQINASCYNIALQPAGNKGPSYNWIGYTALDAVSLDEAFPTMPLAEGDILKSQTDFAYYTHGTWVGTLDKLEPLKGYIYTSNADTVRHFIFPEIGELQVNARTKIQDSRSLSSKLSADSPWTWDPTQWSMNMTAIATVRLDLQPVAAGNIGIFDAEDNCRCIKSITDDGHVYLTISGDDKCDLKMRLQTEDGKIYEQACPFSFTANDSRGTYSEPVVLYFGIQPTGIDQVESEDWSAESGNLYNISGQRIHRPSQKGVFIQDNKKVIR